MKIINKNICKNKIILWERYEKKRVIFKFFFIFKEIRDLKEFLREVIKF